MQKAMNQKETPPHNVGYPPAHEITNISQQHNYPHQQSTPVHV